MKKENVYKLLYVAAALLIVGFIIRLGADYFTEYQYGSAPFYLYVIERFVEFIIPAVACFIAGKCLKNKKGNE